MKLTDEQLRVLVNLESAYDASIQAQRAVADVRPWLTWRSVRGVDYLYEVDRHGNGPSLGPRSPETEARHRVYLKQREQFTAASARVKELETAVHEHVRLYRALRLPLIDSTAGAVLRAADRRGMLGTVLLVVGTNTMAAYEIEARHRFATGLDSTTDLDFAWAAPSAAYALTSAAPVMDLLKDVDDRFTVNTEKPWQARNADAYEVEVLLAPSVAASYTRGETLRPSILPEQEWLLLGNRISHVVVDRSGKPARIVAPDPRWMALHKLWLADKPQRSALKTGKDRAQGLALLNAVREYMPQFPLDQKFIAELPAELRRLVE